MTHAADAKWLREYITLGVMILAGGLILKYAVPPLANSFINKQISLSKNSLSYPVWKNIPVPIYQKFFFFNVTNAQDIEQRGHKPKLEEIGPFVYRSEWTKKDIANDDVKNTIDFKNYKRWVFEPRLSVEDHKMELVTLNAPLAITLTLIQSASNAVRLLVTFSLDGLSDGFFTKRSVKQLLFDGYPDLLTTFGPLLNAEMLSQGGHFGYMNARNSSLDGTYQINTGLDDINKLNTINTYNGRPKLTYWEHHCNSLEGATIGEMFPPMVNNSIKLFQPDFCRIWPLEYERDLEDKESGLSLKRFIATRNVFKNSTMHPPNRCFFKKPVHSGEVVTNRIRVNGNGNNNNNNINNQARPHHHHNRVQHEWPTGVFTLAPCKFNAPIYISMPHFLDADPYFASHVRGMSPDRDKHEFYLDLEPRTGSPVVLSARVQLNVAISKPPGLVRFRNIPEIMFPVFWQELTVNLTGSPLIDQLLLASKAEESILQISVAFLILGNLVILVTAIFYFNLRLRSRHKQAQ